MLSVQHGSWQERKKVNDIVRHRGGRLLWLISLAEATASTHRSLLHIIMIL